MVDRERILAKLDELDGYLGELGKVAPESYEEYQTSIEKRRACERLLHISIECMIDVCNILVTDLRLGLPAGEEDLLEKLERAEVLAPQLTEKLKKMRAFRNILVHKYGVVDDKLVYEVLKNKLDDFKEFKEKILARVK